MVPDDMSAPPPPLMSRLASSGQVALPQWPARLVEWVDRLEPGLFDLHECDTPAIESFVFGSGLLGDHDSGERPQLHGERDLRRFDGAAVDLDAVDPVLDPDQGHAVTRQHRLQPFVAEKGEDRLVGHTHPPR